MPGIDWMGEHGGQLGIAFAMGAAGASGLMMGAGKWIWTKFGEATIAGLRTELEAMKAGREQDQREHESERARDRAECREETRALRDRIIMLETMLLQHASPSLRQAVQAALSEQSVRVEQIAADAVRISREDLQ